jgi:iron complex outermembrane receptor protein
MKLTRTPLASAIALVLMGSVAYSAPSRAADAAPTATAAPAAADNAADPAAAPEAADADAKDKDKKLTTVTVVGIRGALEASIDAKRGASNHVEVVTAEDIGKMPDKNVADSLMRLPGLNTSSASANEGGFDENDRVSMRGTNPSLTQTLMNGHQVSSGDWFVLNQSGTVGRSVTYTLLPSELVSRIVVHKSSEASLVEGGVAGSVDIQSRKPLDFAADHTFSASIGEVYADNPDKWDPQLSAFFSAKNSAGNAGILIQAFSEQRHLRRDGQEILGYSQFGQSADPNVIDAVDTNPDLLGVWYPNLIGSALFEQERKRTGAMIDIQFRPSDNWEIDLNAFTSKLDAPNYNRNYMLWGAHFINGNAPDAGYVVRNNTLVMAHWAAEAGTQTGIYDQISRPDASSDSKFVELALDWRANEALRFKGSFGTTTGHGKTPTQDVAEWDVGKGTGAEYAFHGIGSGADWNLGSEDTATPTNATLDWIFGYQNVNVKDDEQWAQVDGAYSFTDGPFTELKFGLRWTDHERSLDGVIAQGPNWAFDPFNPAHYPQGYENYPGDYADGIGGNFPRDVWYYTPGQLGDFNDAGANRDPISRHYYPAEYALDESNRAGYLQLDFESGRWSGNFGLRYVVTDEHVTSNQDLGFGPHPDDAIIGSAFGNYIPVDFDNTYHDLLPSFNAKFDVNDKLVWRFAASKTMTRADYSALAGNLSLSPPANQGEQGQGSASNPNLKPVRSTNFDTSLEWYFAPQSLLSASLFYMDLTSYIGLGHITQTYFTFSSWAPEGEDVVYVLTAPINSSGSVKGVELAWQQPLWEDFGAYANYTYADGEEDGGGRLVGTSKNTYNLGAYYENERFNARLSYTYRSDFYSGLDRSTAFSQASVGNLSAALSYKINDNFSVSFDALNLNNPTLRYYALNKDQPRSIYQSGRQYYLNLRINF